MLVDTHSGGQTRAPTPEGLYECLFMCYIIAHLGYICQGVFGFFAFVRELLAFFVSSVFLPKLNTTTQITDVPLCLGLTHSASIRFQNGTRSITSTATIGKRKNNTAPTDFTVCDERACKCECRWRTLCISHGAASLSTVRCSRVIYRVL